MLSPLRVLPLLLLATPASAADGVLEINQVCAVQTGCFSGDTAGFPVTIDGTAGRSYRLTSDLTIASSSTDGIRTLITSSDVRIDLNGFSIIGPITCSGAGASLDCSGSGSGNGVEFNSPGGSVRNGTIQGVGGAGAALGSRNTAFGLSVRWSGGVGISASNEATIRDSVVFENGAAGIQTGVNAAISGNVVRDNLGSGIQAGANAYVAANTSIGNGADGIIVDADSHVLDNLSNGNGGDGIETRAVSMIQRNISNDNGGFGYSQAGLKSFLIQNTSSGNVMGHRNSVTIFSDYENFFF